MLSGHPHAISLVEVDRFNVAWQDIDLFANFCSLGYCEAGFPHAFLSQIALVGMQRHLYLLVAGYAGENRCQCPDYQGRCARQGWQHLGDCACESCGRPPLRAYACLRACLDCCSPLMMNRCSLSRVEVFESLRLTWRGSSSCAGKSTLSVASRSAGRSERVQGRLMVCGTGAWYLR